MGTRPQAMRFSWHKLIVLVAVIGLVAGMATRTFHSYCLIHPIAQGDSSNANHQQLDSDAFLPVTPIPQLSMLVPAAAPHARPYQSSVVSVEIPQHLYNRPPPDRSLL